MPAIVRVEALAVGLLLATAGALKLTSGARAAFVATSPLRGRIGASALARAHTALAAGELALGSILALTATQAAMLVAAALLACASLYQVWSLNKDSSAPCGCLGTASRKPPSSLSIAANVLLACGLVLTVLRQGFPWAPGLSAFMIVAGVGTITWKVIVERHPRRRARSDCATVAVTADATLDALRGSTLWTDTARYLRSQTPTDHWREACWRYFTFPGVWQEQDLVAVYTVHVTSPETQRSMVLVDEARGRHVEVFT